MHVVVIRSWVVLVLRLSDTLHAFAAHRLRIDIDRVLDAWVMPQYFPVDMDPLKDNPNVQVFCSHQDRSGHRHVNSFDIKYRELVASLTTFAGKLKEAVDG